jgi:hypothetical protein
MPPPLPPQTPPIYEAPSDDSVGIRMIIPVGRAWQAIAAGYLGLLSILPGIGVLALIFGIWAVRVIRRNPQRHGMGRAIFGIVMGTAGTVLYAVVLFAQWFGEHSTQL